MKILYFLIEVLLIFILSFFITEYRYHFFKKSIQIELKKRDIDIEKVDIKRLDFIELKKISYKNRAILKRIDIDINYLSLLGGYIGFDSVKIDGLKINNLLNLKTHKNRNDTENFLIPIKISKAFIDGSYLYKKELFRFETKISNIKIDKKIFAKINQLFITSKYAKLYAKGYIKNLTLSLYGKAKPNREYLSKIDKNLDFKGLKDIDFLANIDKKKIVFDLNTSAKDILKNSFLKASLNGRYVYDKNSLQSNLLANIKYQNIDAKINSNIFYKKDLVYEGNSTILNNFLISKNLNSQFFKKLNINFKGDLKHISLNIYNSFLKAKSKITREKNKILFSLNTYNIDINDILKDKISKKIYFALSLNGSYQKKLSLSYKILSNLINIKGDLKERQTSANIYLPKDSILKDYHLQKLFPIKVSSNIDIPLCATFSNSLLNGNFIYKKDKIYSKINIQDSKIEISGKSILTIDFSSKSIKNLLKIINKIYPIDINDLDGKIKIRTVLDLNRLEYKSKIILNNIVYKKNLLIKFFTTNLKGDRDRVFIDYYAIALKNHAFYSTKTATIVFKDSKIEVKDFYIEDRVKIDGFYDLKGNGKFNIFAKNYRYSSIEGIANIDTNVIATIKEKKLLAEGNVFINSATIKYNPKKNRSLEDKDIVIVDKDRKKSDFFLNSVALNIHITSKKPLLYQIDGIKADLKSDITLWKEFQKDLNILGEIDILKGNYKFNQKIFYISKSQVLFFGKPTNPYLNIDVKYKKEPYNITIKIIGELENPIISFSSEPYLSQNDILSIILFNSKSSSLLENSSSKGNFAGMFSNFFAKDLLDSFGLKLDSFSLITSESGVGFQIGKKISDKITIIYKNDQISSVIIRYKINRHLKSEALISPNSNALNLYYDIVK